MNHENDIALEDKPFKYWTCQLLGWSFASIYWAYVVYFQQDYTLLHTFINFIFDVAIGVSLTHLYKLSLRREERKSFNKKSLFRLAASIVVLSVLFMLLVNLKWYGYWVYVKGEDHDFIEAMLLWDRPLVTGVRMMTIWVLAYHLYHYYKQQLALTEHNAELSVLAKQIQFDHLSNQLNPHFLFNSLNSVKSLISENPTKAKRSVDLLSDLLRSSIYSKENLITVEDELQLIYDYVELEKLRFEERVKLEVDVDQEVLRYKIPSLCVQTLIENALKHGIQKSIKGGVVNISISKSEETLIVVVRNPGKISVAQSKESESYGLDNLKQRLHLQYKEKATFTLTQESNEVVVATIVMPLS